MGKTHVLSTIAATINRNVRFNVPHGLTWELERAEPPEGADRYRRIETLDGLPALLEGL